MKELIQKVISGGQTGADTGGLKAGAKAGIPTGGCAPRGFLTENGPNLQLGSVYGLYQSASDRYPDRTRENVSKSDATIIFSKGNSPGTTLTKKICEKMDKPYLSVSPSGTGNEKVISEFITNLSIKKGRTLVFNIAGNRESKTPGIEKKVEEILSKVFSGS